MKRIIVLLVGAAIIAPLLVVAIISYPTGIETSNDWIGFYGNFYGGILGGIVAYAVSKYQVDKNNKLTELQLLKSKENLELQIEENRKNILIQIESESNMKRIERLKDSIPALIMVKHDIDNCHLNIEQSTHVIQNFPEKYPDGVTPMMKYGLRFSVDEIDGEIWSHITSIHNSELISKLLRYKHKYCDIVEALNCDLSTVLGDIAAAENQVGKLTSKNISKEKQLLINKHNNEKFKKEIYFETIEKKRFEYIDELENGNLLIEISEIRKLVVSEIEEYEAL